MKFNISVNELLEDILGILTNKEDINLTKHVMEKLEERSLDLKWIYDNLINKIPIYIEKQGIDLFKLHYKHPTKNYKDLVIIVSVQNNKKLNVVTTYEQDIDRRF